MTVKPGQQITLSGDYLNLIEEVIFTDEVAVGIKDFITHTRQEISLVVLSRGTDRQDHHQRRWRTYPQPHPFRGGRDNCAPVG